LNREQPSPGNKQKSGKKGNSGGKFLRKKRKKRAKGKNKRESPGHMPRLQGEKSPRKKIPGRNVCAVELSKKEGGAGKKREGVPGMIYKNERLKESLKKKESKKGPEKD